MFSLLDMRTQILDNLRAINKAPAQPIFVIICETIEDQDTYTLVLANHPGFVDQPRYIKMKGVGDSPEEAYLDMLKATALQLGELSVGVDLGMV